MAEARKTPFRDKLRTFADIHKAAQEDWIISLFQRLCITVQNVDWTSPQFDESKLTVAQNLICVDKCYKKWKEECNSIAAANNQRSPKPSSFQPSSAPPSTSPIAKNSSTSPPHFGTYGLLRRIEGMDIVDADDTNNNNNNNNSSHDSNTQASPTSTSPPSQNIWSSPDPTRNKYDMKKKYVEILNYTIESKFKAIKAIVERTARGIQEKRNVNFILLWLLIENKTHAEEVKYNTINITSLMELISQFKREIINSNESQLETTEYSANGTPTLKGSGDNDITWKATSPAITKLGWNRIIRPMGPPEPPPREPKEKRLPPPVKKRTKPGN